MATLGHMINKHFTDDTDNTVCKNRLIGNANRVLCHFGKLDSVIKNRLFKAYCSSFYGCEIWDLNNMMIESLCVAWRKGARRVWLLPRIIQRIILGKDSLSGWPAPSA